MGRTIKNINEFTIEECESFLSLYPNSKDINQVKERLYYLQSLELELEEKQIFDNCKTIKDYENYTIKFPNGHYKEDATYALTKLKKKKRTKMVFAFLGLFFFGGGYF